MSEPTFKWTKMEPEPLRDPFFGFNPNAETRPRYRLECSNGLSAVMLRERARPALYTADIYDRQGVRFRGMEMGLNLKDSKLTVQERLVELGREIDDTAAAARAA